MDKMILMYGANGDERDAIKELQRKGKLPLCGIIDGNMTDMVIKDIIYKFENNESLPVSKENYNNTILEEDVYSPEEKVFLFNGFANNEIGASMDLIKSISSKKPIFAVVTKTSIEWTFRDLIEHLIEEKRFYEEMARKGKK